MVYSSRKTVPPFQPFRSKRKAKYDVYGTRVRGLRKCNLCSCLFTRKRFLPIKWCFEICSNPIHISILASARSAPTLNQSPRHSNHGQGSGACRRVCSSWHVATLHSLQACTERLRVYDYSLFQTNYDRSSINSSMLWLVPHKYKFHVCMTVLARKQLKRDVIGCYLGVLHVLGS